MSNDDVWFNSDNGFNKPEGSPGAAGNYYESSENIDNIPFADPASPAIGGDFPDPNVDYDFTDSNLDYGYDHLGLGPGDGLHEHHQQPGTSNDVGGQFQMHGMHGNDLYDPHMQTSANVDYNHFERPTIINGNLEYQDLEIMDSNSYFATHQPSTSQEMMINENYEMIGPSTSYSAQMDHVDPSSLGNPLSHSGPDQQQQQQGMNDEQPPQPPPKPKPKKKAPPKKKQTPAAEATVGSVLSTANRLTQRENNNGNRTEQVTARLSAEDIITIGRLTAELEQLKDQGADQAIITVKEAQILQVFSKNVADNNAGESNILNQMMSVANTAAPLPQQQQQQPPAPPKKAAPKKSRSQVSKNVQQQHQQLPPIQQNNQPVVIAQDQTTPSKIMMEPPTTTMVPGNSHLDNMYNNNGSNGYGYQLMDEPGTSQQYSDYHQPPSPESMHQQHHQSQPQTQVIHAKVVPTMNQRTHNYRQAVIFSSQNNGEPGPSPQFQQPQSHESHHMEHIPDQQQYHPQDHQRPESQQMYVPLHQQQEGQMYQQTDEEPTEGDLVRQGAYPSQDAPHLRQHLVSSVNAPSKQVHQRSGAPTPSPGNFYNNNVHQQYAEPYQNQGNYPASHDMQLHSHSQQGYEIPSEASNDFYQGSMQRPSSQMMNVQQETLQHQHYDQQGMYMPAEQQMMEPESEPEIEYPAPEAAEALSREELLEKLAEKNRVREEAVRAILTEQKMRLETPDVTPFKSKRDMMERMLPYHHFSVGEEPVANFDSTYQKTMTEAISRVDVLGKRIRNIVLRDTMHSMEWERNMLLFMETESERRKLEADRRLAEEDPRAFLQGSEIIQAAKCNQLNMELTMRAVPPMPAHLKELDLPEGVLSAVYEEFEFDSYDENRPRGSPLPYFNEKPEWEQESESEIDSEREEEKLPQSDASSLLGSPLISPVQSTSRLRNESESILGWKDDDDTFLVCPESAKLDKISGELSHEVFGTKEEFNKPERFMFERMSDAARIDESHRIKQSHPSESLGSSDESTSSEGTPQPVQHPATTPPRDEMTRSIPAIPLGLTPSTSASSFPPVYNRRPMTYDEGSPEIDDDYSMSPPERTVPVEEIPPIPLPVPVHLIKKEKEENSKLKLRLPVAMLQKSISKADESEKKTTLKVKLNLKDIKMEEPSPDTELSAHSSKSRNSSSMTSKVETRVPIRSEHMSTSLNTPLKDLPETSAESRKRKRSEKIGEPPQPKKATGEVPNSFVTPKNGLIQKETGEPGRFLRTMTDGRKLVMKIGKIPKNINHFVTPRRDSKGNMHKDLSVTENTRLKMRFFKKEGRLAVEVTETSLKSQETTEPQGSNRPSTNSSIVPTPNLPSASVKARPAPASRKGSVDIAGKDKKTNSTKIKNTFCNRFNPFANVSKPKPPTVPASSTSTPSAGSMKITTPAGPSSTQLQQKAPSAPIALTTPKRTETKVIPNSNTAMLTNLIKTTPIVPKITVSNVPTVSGLSSKPEKSPESNNKANSLLPWLFESSAKPKTVKPQPQPVSSLISSIFPSTSQLQVATEPTEAAALTAQQESPRANSSLSFFDDERGNGFPFLRSPKRTNEPLPVVEFSDDDEDDLAHSTFSHATDHLLQASMMNKPVNGTTPILPWTNNP